MPPIPVTDADPDPLLRGVDVARLLGNVHPRTVRRLVERGELRSVRVGRLLLYRVSAVQAYLDRASVAAR